MEEPLTGYRKARRQIVEANDGLTWLSVPALLPNAPRGVWEQVSTSLGMMESPPSVLSHLHCELVLDPDSKVLGEPRVSLDGFLGSHGHRMHPGLLVPAIALWLRSKRDIQSAATEFVNTVVLWETLTRSEYPIRTAHLVQPDALKPFLAWGRVPRRALVNEFVTQVLARLGTHRKRSPEPG